jgi:hypothetical protein
VSFPTDSSSGLFTSNAFKLKKAKNSIEKRKKRFILGSKK